MTTKIGNGLSLLGQKITSLANGSAATDAAAYGQLLATPPYYYLMPTGAIAETFSRIAGAASAALTSGVLELTAIPLLTGTTVTDITFLTGSTAAVTPTHWWYGLYDNNLNQLAVTADQTTTAIAANTSYSLQLATAASGSISNYTLSYSGLYYLGWMATAGTMPTLLRLAGAGIAAMAAVSPILASSSDTAQTTPPGFPHQTAALTKANAIASNYAYVS